MSFVPFASGGKPNCAGLPRTAHFIILIRKIQIKIDHSCRRKCPFCVGREAELGWKDKDRDMGQKQGKSIKGTLAAVPVTGIRDQMEKEEREKKKQEEKMLKKGISLPKSEEPTEADLMETLKALVTKHDVDPNIYYKDLVVLGQGASGTVYSAKDSRTGKTVRQIYLYMIARLLTFLCPLQVAIKQMIIGKRVEREVLINEISIMKEGAGCDQIVQYYESYIVFAQQLRDEDKLWVLLRTFFQANRVLSGRDGTCSGRVNGRDSTSMW